MQWCVLVQWEGSENWFRAAARFSDKESATEYARNEWQRHPTMKAWRVEPASDEGMRPAGHSSDAETSLVTSEMCTARDLFGYAGRMTATERQPLTVPTWEAARIVLQVAALLFAGTYGLMCLVGFALWLYWR